MFKNDAEAKAAGYEMKEGKYVKIEKLALPKTYTLKNVEIFAAGKPKGKTYTEKDIIAMAKDFYTTKAEIRPYVKLGHDEKQKLAQKSGLPSLGWIDDLRVKGKKLVADISGVPKVIYDLVNAGAYKRISSEIFWNIPVAGKTYKYLLKAISFLGGDTPAVGSLKDIVALYNVEPYKSDSETDECEFEVDKNTIVMVDEHAKKLKDLTMKEIGKAIADLNIERNKLFDARTTAVETARVQSDIKSREIYAKIQVLEERLKEMLKTKEVFSKEEEANMAEVDDLKKKVEKLELEKAENKKKLDAATQLAADEKLKSDALEADRVKAQEDAATQKEADLKLEIDTAVTGLIKDKHILPVSKDAISALLFDLSNVAEVKTYKIGEEEKSSSDILLDVLGKQVVDLNTEEGSETGVSTKDDTGQALHAKAMKYSKDNEVSYKDALIAVSPEEKQ